MKAVAALLLAVLPLATAAPAGAQDPHLEKTASDVITATLNYRAALERVLPIYERELARRTELAAVRQELFNRGVLNQREFNEGQRGQAEAQKNVNDTRRAIADTDRMLTEARLAQALARLTPRARPVPRRAPSGTSPGPAPSSSPSR